MNKVYVVTRGEYSDYHICGVFDEKEKASLFINSFDNDEYMIEEWNLNPYELELKEGMCPFFVRMAKNGDVLKSCKVTSDYGFDEYELTSFDVRGNIYIRVFAKDEKHAIKICNERRTIAIANNEWPNKE